ncbi:hypothetical protein QBC47DRAFT_308084, partial [Echria macrotheca]
MSHYPTTRLGLPLPEVTSSTGSTLAVPAFASYDAMGTVTSFAGQVAGLGKLGGPIRPPLPRPHRASSGAWNPKDDRALLALRAMGKNWNQIQREAFPGKTGNACRKRYERLMELRGRNDFDSRKFERLSAEYMKMRKEIWQPLAQRVGERWDIVEAQLMSNGLRFIQSHEKAYAGRKGIESGHPLPGYDDDSDISGRGLTPID